MEGNWFTEKQTPGVAISCMTKDILHTEETPYQRLAILDTLAFGRMLTLDGVIQTTIADEFVYHEMIAHVPLNTLPNPKRALVIGGGDGGSIREIIKHPSIEKATLVEIDERVVVNAKEYLPEISCALDDPRVEVRIEDGIKFVQQAKGEFDLIIVDSTDPIGPAVGLFSKEFYGQVFEALTEDGIFVAQTESPFYNRELLTRIKKDVSSIYPVCRIYTAFVPTYPGGYWSFTMGSKRHDPLKVQQEDIPQLKTRYYTPAVHHASFILPQFVVDYLKEE